MATWVFQDAKARLSEVVRRARSEGPQHVTVHGGPAVVIVAEEEFRRLRGDVTGAALIRSEVVRRLLCPARAYSRNPFRALERAG